MPTKKESLNAVQFFLLCNLFLHEHMEFSDLSTLLKIISENIRAQTRFTMVIIIYSFYYY